MNENLTERSGRSRSAFRPESERAEAWVLPQRLNERVKQYYDELTSPVAAGEWASRAEIPTSSEVMDDATPSAGGSAGGSSDVLIPLNKRKGAWSSKEAYLSTHYELLREDALRPLREAVEKIRMTPDANEDSFDGSVGIYEKVHICGVTCSTRGVAIRVTFSLRRVGKLVRWEQSKRLIGGGLVVLSPRADMYSSKAIVAVVAARPLEALEQNPPEIDLFIPRAEEQEIDPAVEWVMVEDRGGLFEAARHTLLALQRMMREPFPLQEHLVDMNRAISAPDYVQRNPKRNMSTVFKARAKGSYENVDVLKRWPQQPDSDLDQSQQEALQRILTKKLAIVQGPPGTGKTHVSVQAMRVMLDNRKEDDPPVVIACQTNHAVDQILRHIAKYEPDFVRLGGRSKDKDVIKSRTLHEVRKLTSENPIAGSCLGSAKKSMRDLEKRFKVVLSLLDAKEKKPLDVETLKDLGILTPGQATSLEAGASKWVQSTLTISNESRSPFLVWLGKNLISVAPRQLPEDFGFEFEEADLEMEQLKEMEAENVAKDDDDFESLRGEWIPIADHFTGRHKPGISASKVQEALASVDLWKIPEDLRPAVYRHLQAEAKKLLLTSFRELTKLFNEQAQRCRIGFWEQHETILKRQKIIGMTTTGFSKYRGLISALQPKIVLIEEAAETLEAPVTVTCIPSLEHLILVGDHQQLRPHTHCKAHEKDPYWLNVSMFERLVANKLDYTTLSVQRRMIPEIRRLLYPIYKDKITDHACVTNPDGRPNVPGMGGVNSWFFSHQWPERRDEQMSAYNPDEADMIVGLVEYLVYNGMETEDITVLTFYNGQRKKILSELRKKPSMANRRFNVVTVDSYQGEENEVVILSLVRSNNRGAIGFLSNDNRVCVALSRARCGFYVMGNAHMLYAEQPPPSGEKKPIKNYPTWAKVIDAFANWGHKADRLQIEPTNRLDPNLIVTCKNHAKETAIAEPNDWALINGGCDVECGSEMPCGHTCTLKCHPFPHDKVVCQESCRRTLPCGHSCAGRCGEVCLCGVCAKAREKMAAEQYDGYDGEEKLAEMPSSGHASSTDSWHSFTREEPIRYAGARSTHASRRESLEKGLRSHSKASFASNSSHSTGAADMDKKLKTLKLDVTAATASPSGTSPLTAIPDKTPTGPKAKSNTTEHEVENLIDF